MNIPKEFIINRQGKDMILYKGLLALAHDKGIKAIHTSVYQPPLDANNHIAIVTATVIMADGTEWAGVGDADKNNVNPNIAPHIIRMAETRAKARALRDALNIGMVADVELALDDEPASKPARVSVTRETVDSKVGELFPTVTEQADPAADLRRKLERLVRSKAPKGQGDAKWKSAKNWAKQNRGVDVDSATVDSLQAIYDELKGKR